MSSTPTPIVDIAAAVKAAHPGNKPAVAVTWQARPTRSGGSWVLTVRLGGNVVTADLHALEADRPSADAEARTIIESALEAVHLSRLAHNER